MAAEVTSSAPLPPGGGKGGHRRRQKGPAAWDPMRVLLSVDGKVEREREGEREVDVVSKRGKVLKRENELRKR